ncbi:unnamed protein product [Microthlaspi erraticum]|uniref:Uncharacterized protein n=1 Tax=Microthlaspi erraticum TaxID=1685480 RepID=A0A6D2IQL2_9BRAS|nr:unnamed protein product [Microthlaspi erraticum]
MEILLRLPAKSIGRFPCVSKLWSSTITSPHFVKSFAVRSLARPCLLAVKKEEDERVLVYSLPYRLDYPQIRVEEYQMMLPLSENSCDIPQSVNGLISFQSFESFIIWNPTLRQHVTLPEAKLSRPFITMLGYDPIGGEYKVLSMSLNGQEAQIFTVGAGETWRTLQNSPSLIHPTMRIWRCIKGVVYYYSAQDTVVSFDVRSEKFKVIQTPKIVVNQIQRLHFSEIDVGFISHMGRLAWFTIQDNELINLWVLEDAEKHEWLQEESVLPFEIVTVARLFYLLLSGETADGELIYLPTWSSEEPMYANNYDLKKGSVRKVEYEGIDDKKLIFDYFPEHIECLMSLNNLLAVS